MLGARDATLVGQGRDRRWASFARAIARGATRDEIGARSTPDRRCSTRPRRRWRPTRRARVRPSSAPSRSCFAKASKRCSSSSRCWRSCARASGAELTRPVHFGWTSALVAGVLTWWAATSLITVSGASRELTEGFGSLLAAAVLLFVGIWMHGKAQAGRMAALYPARRSTTRCRASRAGSCSCSPSSPSIAKCSRRSCSSPRWPQEGTPAALVARRRSPGRRRWR